MTSFEEMLAKRPLDKAELEAKTQRMHEQAHFYQLRELRKEAGLTQQQVAENLGVSQHRISQIENGNLSKAQIGTLEKYLSAVGATLSISAQTPSGVSLAIR